MPRPDNLPPDLIEQAERLLQDREDPVIKELVHRVGEEQAAELYLHALWFGREVHRHGFKEGTVLRLCAEIAIRSTLGECPWEASAQILARALAHRGN